LFPKEGDMGATVVSGMSVSRTVTVGNAPDGLHMRPAMAFAKLARGFRCTVSVRHGDRTADGRSQHDLLMLIALPGDQLELHLEGEDADIAIHPLVAILVGQDD
jgi:phosphotransferase system HPr (HPr) family protein